MHRYYGNIDILLNGLRDNTCNAFQIIWKLYQPKWILNAADGHTRVRARTRAHTRVFYIYIYIFWNFNQPLYDQLVSRQTRYWIKQTLFALVQNYDSQATIAETRLTLIRLRFVDWVVSWKKREKKKRKEEERNSYRVAGGRKEEGSNTGTDNRYFFIMTTQGNYSASW